MFDPILMACVCVALAGDLRAQVPVAPAAPSAASTPAEISAAPTIVLENTDGQVETRAARGFETGDPRQLGARVVRFEGFGVKPPPQDLADSGVIELANGDKLYGRIRGGRAELLDVEVAGPLHVGVSVDEVRSVIFPARIPNALATPLTPAKEGDRLYRRERESLDRIDGGVEEFTSEGVRFHGATGSKLIPWTEVSALFVESLAQSGASTRAETQHAGGAAGAPAVPIIIDLIEHSRVRGALKKLTGETCRWISPSGAELESPTGAIAQLCVDDGSIAYLSALKPSSAVDSTPFGDDLGMRWPHRIDQSVTGTPLAAGGRVHMRGIGMHAPSRVAWTLDGSYKTLRGSVAVDDQVLRLAARGSVIFRIHVDGAKRWESGVVHGGDPPVVIPAQNIAGAHELTLEVDMADQSCVADRADWLDVVLIRG
jgi:hypothetical protein